MPRPRKKRMKLPNGYGSIKYLGDGRRKPYAAYPSVTEWKETGPVTPPALGYMETWEEGYELLTAYNMEKQGKIQVASNVFIDHSPLFSDVYEKFYEEKFETNKSRTFSNATKNSTAAAYKNCSPLHNQRVTELTYDDLQRTVNACPLKHSSIELIISLLKQMYAYMIKHGILEKNHSEFLYNPKAEDDESGEPFHEDELKILWADKANPITQMILIMIYSGFRIKAFEDIEVNMEERYFKGGIKTAAGKNRTVPIHPAIYEFVKSRCSNRNLLGCTPQTFRMKMYQRLSELGIAESENHKKHTPHDCRHTFSMLCEKYEVNENDRKRMMGHSFGGDITNNRYGHRTVDDLRKEIEKIQIPE